MRLVVDLQGAQGLSRHRGIGRYCLSLTRSLLQNSAHHEVIIVLSDRFPETIQPIQLALAELITPEQIRIFHLPNQVRGADPESDARRDAAELIREQFLTSLSPDLVLVTSMFEGFEDDAVTSIGRFNTATPTAVILFDLIPLINREIYLQDPAAERYYERKLSSLRRADLILSISESTRGEAVNLLGFSKDNVVNISSAADDHFKMAAVDNSTLERISETYGLVRPFVMYTGGIDHRKNIEGLIQAYSRLPEDVRKEHQLAIVCSIQETDRARLLAVALDYGLSPNEIILTGYIPEDDLLACYLMCKLFVFPSWHEGFGLPVLEAMKCGRAVLASNRSSLPEVVGLVEALFDPFDIDSMSALIGQVLCDSAMRERLEEHSLSQAENFSWKQTAILTWAALEAEYGRAKASPTLSPPRPNQRPRLAYFSPLPPEASGISEYSAELLPELARHYQIDVIVHQESVNDPALLANHPVRSVDWFRRHARKFDRIIYHFGNSQFHAHMFDVLRDHPGVVVLHDFFLSGIISYSDFTGENPGGWARALFDAHGWKAVLKRFRATDSAEVVWAYPCNMQVLEDALGVIVHANFSRQLAQDFYGNDADKNWHLIPHLRKTATLFDRERSREILGIAEQDLVVCSFGILAQTKMNDRLISAWLASPLSQDARCHLVFVGENLPGSYGIELEQSIRSGLSARPIEITGRVDTTTFRRWLSAADVGIQLRTLSRGETSGTVLDCMNAGLATVVNANGSMAELPADAVWQLRDDFTDMELIEALTKLHSDRESRLKFGSRARARIAAHNDPRECASAYADAIERSYEQAETSVTGLMHKLRQEGEALRGEDWQALCVAMGQNAPPMLRRKRILVDISELVRKDWETGIQRVVYSILGHWLNNQPDGWIVEPVYASRNKTGYRYARQFACRMLDIPDDWCTDEVVEPVSGDVFLGLDLDHIIIPQQKNLLDEWRRIGVTVRFVLYDLLPVLNSEFFLPGAKQQHHLWLKVVTQFDGVICISRSVANEFKEWLDHFKPQRCTPLAIDWFHLGSDLDKSNMTSGMPDNADTILRQFRERPTFLMVGTIEPRKAVDQVLAAVEMLWEKNFAVNLTIIGKSGWLMDDFIDLLRHHPQLNKQLFWLEAISDEYLEAVYGACDCLVAASKGEGFGLPIIEAARHNLAILARDLPVFREVAGDGAMYFRNSQNPAVIAEPLERIMQAQQSKAAPHSPIKFLTWAESADTLLNKAIGNDTPYQQWLADDIQRFWGNDVRLTSLCGALDGRAIRTSGRSGILAKVPHIHLKAGTYLLTARGEALHLSGMEKLNIFSENGKIKSNLSLKCEESFWKSEHFITIPRSIDDLIVELWVEETSKLSIDSIIIEPVH